MGNATTIFFGLTALTFGGMAVERTLALADTQAALKEAQADVKGISLELDHMRKLMDTQAIAIQNNNPCNIKALGNGELWQGQYATDKFNHAIFTSPEYGFRAASLVLRSYYKVHGIDTVEKLVKRFAEGNQQSYIKYLCRKLDVQPDESFNFIKRMPELLQYISYFETGKEWDKRYFVAYDILTKI